MGFYRLYFMDPAGHIQGVRQLEAMDEAQAIGRAERIGQGEKRELWRLNTLLKCWQSDVSG
jgi:hypothetical protein